jgi:Leucine-rich repeat (LRR) protein
MKLTEIPFEDEAFKAVIFNTGAENAEDIIELRARKKSISSIKGIEHLPNLKLLDLTRNQLVSANLSANVTLEEIYLGNNEIEELQLGAKPNLTRLEIFFNDIENLDLSGAPNLEDFCATRNELVQLDLSANTKIEEISVNDNHIAELKLPENCIPRIVKAENNPLPDTTKEWLRSVVEANNLRL